MPQTNYSNIEKPCLEETRKKGLLKKLAITGAGVSVIVLGNAYQILWEIHKYI